MLFCLYRCVPHASISNGVTNRIHLAHHSDGISQSSTSPGWSNLTANVEDHLKRCSIRRSSTLRLWKPLNWGKFEWCHAKLKLLKTDMLCLSKSSEGNMCRYLQHLKSSGSKSITRSFVRDDTAKLTQLLRWSTSIMWNGNLTSNSSTAFPLCRCKTALTFSMNLWAHYCLLHIVVPSNLSFGYDVDVCLHLLESVLVLITSLSGNCDRTKCSTSWTTGMPNGAVRLMYYCFLISDWSYMAIQTGSRRFV